MVWFLQRQIYLFWYLEWIVESFLKMQSDWKVDGYHFISGLNRLKTGMKIEC